MTGLTSREYSEAQRFLKAKSSAAENCGEIFRSRKFIPMKCKKNFFCGGSDSFKGFL